MSNTLSKVLIFAAGAAIGSIVTWRILKPKYERLVEEEIESVRKAFGVNEAPPEDEPTEKSDVVDFAELAKQADEEARRKRLQEYNDIIQREKYNSSIEREEHMSMDEPYVITPEEFDEHEDYSTEFLTYYANGVLVKDIYDEIVPDREIPELVGRESLEHFGDYEDELVHVRNDRLKCDFEISIDTKKYIDVNSMVDPQDVED